MEGVLAGFVGALRAAGVETSTAETLDAARTVALMGYADRADLKAALGAVLAKSADEKATHDRVFDLYFSVPDLAVANDRTTDDAQQAAVSRAAAAVGVDDIRFDTQQNYFVGRMLGELNIDAMAPGEARDTLQRQARAWVRQRFELFGAPATEAFMTEVTVHRALGRMAPLEMERMKVAVARMAKKLAAHHSRRQRVKLRGEIDFRRTLRANAGHDGVPFTLAYKHRRRDKPRIVAVCDVSGSVAAQVRFLLLFLYALHDAVGDLRSFAFSNDLKDVTAALESMPFDDAMAHILDVAGSGSTDYGQAWIDLHEHHWETIDRRTTVIVLGDGRSNGTDPQLGLFAELASRAKRVLWLCPEPPARWGRGDSAMLRYQPYCDRVTHCATAVDLERALDEAFDAYH
ncbi:VWA domain-containing protein [soil metagenome]